MLSNWIAEAAKSYPEREVALQALWVSVLTRGNVLFLGPAGTAKTTLVVAFAEATGLKFFGTALSPWTDESSLLGPVDIGALKEGRLARREVGFLPTANLVFLDEIPRAGRGIRDLLLPALATRTMPDGRPIPATAIVCAANTEMTDEDDRAFVDRCAIVVPVLRIKDKAARLAVTMSDSQVPTLPVIRDLGKYQDIYSRTVIPPSIREAMSELMHRFAGNSNLPDISERRWKSAFRSLRAFSALHDRERVSWGDLSFLTYCLITEPGQITVVQTEIQKVLPPCGKQLRLLADHLSICLSAAQKSNEVGKDPDRLGKGDIMILSTRAEKTRQFRREIHDPEIAAEADAYIASSETLIKELLA